MKIQDLLTYFHSKGVDLNSTAGRFRLTKGNDGRCDVWELWDSKSLDGEPVCTVSAGDEMTDRVKRHIDECLEGINV